MSNELFKKIDELLEKAPENRPSYFQMKYFVLGSLPTIQAQLWQCLRELQSKKESMDNLTLEIANQKDQLSLIQIDLERETSHTETEHVDKKSQKLHDRTKQIKLNILKRQEESTTKNINKLDKKLEFVTQEARFYVQAFESLSKTEELRDFDDYEAQKEFWETKISEEINLKALCHQSLNYDLLKTILSLPDESKVKIELTKSLSKGGLNEKAVECRSKL